MPLEISTDQHNPPSYKEREKVWLVLRQNQIFLISSHSDYNRGGRNLGAPFDASGNRSVEHSGAR